MGPTSLALAAAVGLTAAGGVPELVILPPAPDGVDQQSAIESWNAITKQLGAARGDLKVSLALQKEAHDALLGPAREQAWDCGVKARCLTDLGGTLGADLLVTGTLSKTRCSLILLDVAQGRKITGAKSSKKLEGAPAAKKAQAAARGLIAAYLRVLKKGKKAGADTVADAGDAERPAAGASKKGAAKEPKEPKEPKGAKASKGKGAAAGAVAKASARSGGSALDERIAEPPAPPPGPPAEKAGSSIDGMIRIPASQLEDVVSVTVDGASLSRRDDGSMIWIGAPGTHSVAARRADGSRFSKDVVVDPRATMELTLTFVADTTPELAGSYEDRIEPKSPFETWWFWTSLGVALVVGGATSIALVTGDKGGPAVGGDTGSITGTY